MVDVSPYAWTTLALVREHLRFAASDTSKDEQLKSFINRSMGMLERYIGRQIKARDYTEYQDGDGSDRVLVDQWPIISIASLHSDADRDFTSETLIDTTDYISYAEGRIELVSDEGNFPEGEQNIKIVYNAGYAAIPDDLEYAATVHVAYMYNKSGHEGHTAISLGGLSKSYDPAPIPQDVKFALEPYKRRPV